MSILPGGNILSNIQTLTDSHPAVCGGTCRANVDLGHSVRLYILAAPILLLREIHHWSLGPASSKIQGDCLEPVIGTYYCQV